MNSKRQRVVRVKTLDELLDTGWEYDSNGDLLYGGSEDALDYFVLKIMFHFLGSVIPLREDPKNEWVFDDEKMEDTWTITKEMIQEELNPDDYPEFFI